MSRVLVTGVTGQDGSLMCDYLLKETNCDIYGAVRRLSVANHSNILHLYNNPRFQIVNLDLQDQTSINNAIKGIMPDFVINFAAQSFVGESWNSPNNTFDINAMGVIRLLEAIRNNKPGCRFYSAGTSEQFGDVMYSPQNESHPFRPRSPYGASKCSANHIVKVYRESYGIFAVHCILFNHEGIRRGSEFVTRKITRNICRISKELKEGIVPKPLVLGNIFTKRDWSDAEDFIKAVWLILNQENPREYVLGSGESHTIKEFIDLACKYVYLENLVWEIDEEDVEKTRLYHITPDGRRIDIVNISKSFYRPAEVDVLVADTSKIQTELGWKRGINFENLVKKMIDNDIGIE